MLKKTFLSISLVLSMSLNIFAQEINKEDSNSIEKTIENFNKKDFKNIYDNLSDDIKKMMDSESFSNAVKGLNDLYGDILEKELIYSDKRLYTFKVKFKNDTSMYMSISFDENNKLKDFLFKPLSKEVNFPKIDTNTKVEDILNSYKNTFPKVSLAVSIIDNKKEKDYLIGQFNHNNKPIDENTIFEIGSISKVFTTSILADLHLKNKLDLKTNLSKLLPNNIKAPKYKGKEINLEQLATHTSGLERLPVNFTKTVKDPLNPYSNYQINDLWSGINNYDIKNEQKYSYSNWGMGLLGDLLAYKYSNNEYSRLLDQKISNVLNLKSTKIYLSKNDIRNLVSGYSEGENEIPNWDFSSIQGAGAIKSNLKDMKVFLKANMGIIETPLNNSLKFSHKKIFDAGNNLEIALGWHIVKLNDKKIIFHNGMTGGYSSFLGFTNDYNKGVLILSNNTYDITNIAFMIFKILEN